MMSVWSMLFVLLIASVLILNYMRIKRLELTQEQQALALLLELRQLFEYLPQHRGMANAYLQGDESFKSKLEHAQVQIDKSISKVRAKLQACPHQGIRVRWQRIQAMWRSLHAEVKGMAVAASFAAHTKLIRELLYLISDVADVVAAASCHDKKVRFVSQLAFDELPQLMEAMGQARGVGTGAAIAGVLSVAQRVKLSFLSQCVTQRLEAVGGGELSADASVRAVLEPAQGAGQELNNLIQRELLQPQTISIASAQYYDAATQAISANFILLDKLADVVAKQLQQRAQLFASKRLWVIVAMVITWLGLLLLL